MAYYTQLLTFGANAVQFTALTGLPAGLCARIWAEPLASNTHRAYAGLANVTNDGSGTGVIREIAAGSATATVALDLFADVDDNGQNRIDMSELYFHGFAGEKIKVTVKTT
jgi:hypothetical protein